MELDNELFRLYTVKFQEDVQINTAVTARCSCSDLWQKRYNFIAKTCYRTVRPVRYLVYVDA